MSGKELIILIIVTFVGMGGWYYAGIQKSNNDSVMRSLDQCITSVEDINTELDSVLSAMRRMGI